MPTKGLGYISLPDLENDAATAQTGSGHHHEYVDDRRRENLPCGYL